MVNRMVCCFLFGVVLILFAISAIVNFCLLILVWQMLGGLNKTQFEMELIEKQVKLAWKQEQKIHKALFGKPLKRNAPLCQAICRLLKYRLGDIFPITELSIKYKDKTHLILLVEGDQDYIVDGTIKQFFRGEKRNVFTITNYPLGYRNVELWRLPTVSNTTKKVKLKKRLNIKGI